MKLKRAVKMVRNNATMEDKSEFLREAETMMMLEHENLVKLIGEDAHWYFNIRVVVSSPTLLVTLGVAVQQAPWLAVLEFCEHGDVRSVVRACHQNRIRLTAEEQVSFSQQLAGGMAHLTAQRLVHMDLAARNCLLAHANVVKVADFGLTRKLDPGTNHLVLRERLKLPLKWLSLEALEKKVFGEASDCWSFGILMWEILSYGETPYVRVDFFGTGSSLLTFVHSCSYADIRTADVQNQVRNGVRLQMPPGSDRDFWAIITRCWSADPRARWTFARLQASLQDLLLRLPSGPKRDIGVYLKSKGKDTGESNPRLKSPKDMFHNAATAVVAAQKFKKLNSAARPSTAPEQPRTPQRAPQNGTASADRGSDLSRAATSRPPAKTPQSATQLSQESPLLPPRQSSQQGRPATAPRQFAARPDGVAPRRSRSSQDESQKSGAEQSSTTTLLNPMSVLSRLGLPQYAPLLREKKVKKSVRLTTRGRSLILC